MDTSPNTDPRPFASTEWDSYIVEREPQRIWFGFGWQRDAGFFCFFFAFAFALGSAGVFLEGKGLQANLADAFTCFIGIAVLIAAVVFAFAGVKLLRSTNRIGMLDVENRSFSSVDPKTGKTKKAFSCEQLYIHMDEAVPADGDVGFYGKIMIIGSDKPYGTQASPEIKVTLFHSIPYEYFFKAVGELEKAASWKGLIQQTHL